MVSSVLIFMFVPLKSSNDHIQTFPIPIFSQLLKCTPKQNIHFYQDQINLQPLGGPFFFFSLRIQIDYNCEMQCALLELVCFSFSFLVFKFNLFISLIIIIAIIHFFFQQNLIFFLYHQFFFLEVIIIFFSHYHYSCSYISTIKYSYQL